MENVIAWKFCPHCGKELQAEWKCCPECGNSIGAMAQPQIIYVPVIVPQIQQPINPPWTPYQQPFWSSPNTCSTAGGFDMSGVTVWAGAPHPELRTANSGVCVQ